MQVGIVAGFGQVIGTERLAALRAHGFSLIRQDLQTVMGRKPDIPGVLQECDIWTTAGGRVLYIVDETTISLVPPGSWVEYLNEPEYMTPLEYANHMGKIRPIVIDKGLTLWAGCIGNLDQDSIQWLRNVLVNAPYLTHISVHRYSPTSDQAAYKSHKGFVTRDAEVAALRNVIGDRPYIVSEVGYHTAWRRKWLFWRTRLSERDQANRLIMELDYWKSKTGCKAVCVYQENDGPGDTVDKYGLRDDQGNWKTLTIYG